MMMFRSCRFSEYAFFLLGTVSSLVALSLLFPSSFLGRANAAVPACISNGDYGTVSAVEDPNNSTSNNVRGTIASEYIPAGPTDCQRVSSVYVQTAVGSGMEFGAVVGYSNCSGSTYAHAHLFYWAQYSNGAHSCRVFSQLPNEGAYDTMQVSDTNANSNWGVAWNSTNLVSDSINMDFTQGYSLTGMERGGSTDSGYARWVNLQEYHDGNGWSLWDNASLNSDTDPAYHYSRVNAYTVASVHD